MPLRIAAAAMEQLRQHLERGYPFEACGALIGRAFADGYEATEFAPMRNVVEDRPRDRYSLDPLEQLRVQRDAERRGLEIVGFAHSHPDHPARPSQFDTDHGWPFYSYLVAAVHDGKFVEARSWRLDEATKQFQEEPVEEFPSPLQGGPGRGSSLRRRF